MNLSNEHLSNEHNNITTISNLRKFIKVSGFILSIIAGLFTIIATSGDSGDSTVTPETPPASISIVTPNNNQVFVEGDYVSFVCQISDAVSTETYTYSWVSSLDGSIGTTANFSSNSLTAGTHKITLTLSDSKNNTIDSDSITIKVGDSSTSASLPEVSITAPSGDLFFNVGETITFTGSAKDYKGNAVAGSSLLWSSSINGAMGSGDTITSGILSKGQHTITLTAKDTKGNSNSAFIIITVGNSASAPVVKITTPVSGDSSNPASPPNNYDVKAGDMINFTGSAADYDGTVISDENLEWIFTKNEKFFTGSHFVLNTRSVEALSYEPLKEGVHTIYLKANGRAGTAQASITINVVNAPPVSTITNPPEKCLDVNTICKTFAPGEFIDFEGTATDTEDGDLSGKSLEWYSDRDGLLGYGNSLNIKTDNVDALGNKQMSNGEHLITLKAQDDWGASGIDSVIINIGTNTPPVPKISYYNSNSETNVEVSINYEAGTFMTFYGTAEDAEDGSLTSDRLEWYSSNKAAKLTPEETPDSTKLTSSVRVNLSEFAKGSTYSLTLVATDKNDSKGVASINIEISDDGLATIANQ